MRTLEQIIPKGTTNEEFLAMCSLDPAYFGEHVFGLQIMPFHKEWFDLIQKNQRVAIVAPRGSGKTTILGVVYPLWMSFFQNKKQIMIISSNLDNSTKVLEQIKIAIEDNELLSALIPTFKQLTWSKTEINTSTKCKIYCKPYTSGIRGSHVDYCNLDESSLFGDKAIFYQAISPIVNAKKGKIVLIGTPQMETDLLMEVMSSGHYVSKSYKIYDEKGQSIWPERFSKKELGRIKEEIGEAAFAKEYLVDPTSAFGDMAFNPNRVADSLDKNMTFTINPSGENYLGVDLGISTSASWTAVTVVEKTPEEKYLVRFIYMMRGIAPDIQADKIAEYAKAYNAKSILVDQSGFGIDVIKNLRLQGLKAEGQEFQSQARMGLMTTLITLFENGKIIIPYSTDDSTTFGLINKLIKQLNGFTIETTNMGIPTYKSHTKNDDLVMSLSLACKAAVQQRRFLDYMAVG